MCPFTLNNDTETDRIYLVLLEQENSNNDWDSVEQRRKFILSFAKEIGFDPLVAQNWRNKLRLLKAYGVYIHPFSISSQEK